MDVQAAVDDVFSLFGDFGNDDYIGEMVSQEQHALQAAHLAETEGFPPEIIIGALLHDIGHLHGKRLSKPHMITDGLVYGICNHEALGQEYLEGLGFPSEVSDFVRRHVDAKRYLVTTDPNYYERLSPASKTTLEHQGGRMTEAEVEVFRKDPKFQAILRMRDWDERAKDPSVVTPSLQHYKDICLAYLSKRCK
ncbi:2-amino-1-hydroxyethylphosphonate dioxygenase (glycine-forming)-like isoform X1 [Macrobrachium rosenbergii]|uniref:2-amino-1-hydroxyethylphosphonate dioxygenase (glycine-forming)-like isoform X1 n=1 Tax=Macrobrachium rosenbergii TaxID=79674 RepID=UPI0034D6E714